MRSTRHFLSIGRGLLVHTHIEIRIRIFFFLCALVIDYFVLIRIVALTIDVAGFIILSMPLPYRVQFRVIGSSRLNVREFGSLRVCRQTGAFSDCPSFWGMASPFRFHIHNACHDSDSACRQADRYQPGSPSESFQPRNQIPGSRKFVCE